MNAFAPVVNTEAAGCGDPHDEVDPANALVERFGPGGLQSTAEMLQELRRAFPHSPLSVRVRALEALRRR